VQVRRDGSRNVRRLSGAAASSRSASRGADTRPCKLRAPKEFHEKTLWPEYLALSKELNAHLHDLTTRVIREAIDDDVSEPTEQASTKALPEANGA
jgi:hypothetical protein